MTVVDTSVAIAMIKDESDAETWIERLSGLNDLVLPGSCYLEAVMVLSKVLPNGRAWLDRWVETYRVTILGQDAGQARLAADAFERYGRGTGHSARLNFGDCLAYAAAAAHAAPLLYKGEDFSRTDVLRAVDG